ncbi:MAG: tyrosine-type recombinase/integrase [Planctomycetaceae bacterium]
MVLPRHGQRQRQRVRLGRWPEITVDQARKLARKHVGTAAEGKHLPTSGKLGKEKLGGLWEHYLETHAKPHKRTWKRDEREFDRWFGDWKLKPISAITRGAIAKRVAEVGDKHGKYQGNKCRALLSTIFGVALSDGLVEVNPVVGTKRFDLNPRQRYLKPAEVQSFFNAVGQLHNETAKHFFLMLIATGQRRTAVAGMQWGELDIEGRLWNIPADRSKSKKPFSVPLGDFALAVLKARGAIAATSPFVFPGRGKAGHYNDPKASLRRIRDLSGIDDVTVHDLRRTIGSWASQGGLSLRVVQQMLAHSDPRVTASTYTFHESENIRAGLNATIDKLLEHAGDDRPKLTVVRAG